MTARTRSAAKKATDATPAPAPAKKTAAKRTTAAASRPARKRTPRKATADRPRLSLVKTPQPLPTRHLPFMTDTQGYATLAARIAGILTPHINDWRDHRNGTATRPLDDGSLLHYNLTTRTLTWQAVCRMGATHAYTLTSPSTAAAARVHADRCTQLHADLTTIPALTADELAGLGLLQTPTWARKDLIGEEPTQSIPIPVPAAAPQPRALADQLTHSGNGIADTQPLSPDEIAAHIAQQQAADNEQPKGHPEP